MFTLEAASGIRDGHPLQHSNGLADESHRHLTQQILRALQEIRYGSVEIIIHDSRIVQN